MTFAEVFELTYPQFRFLMGMGKYFDDEGQFMFEGTSTPSPRLVPPGKVVTYEEAVRHIQERRMNNAGTRSVSAGEEDGNDRGEPRSVQ